MKFSSFAKAAAVAVVVAGAATAAQARTNVFFSVSAPIAPGVVIGASNAPAYYSQGYAQPYYAPAPVYYETAYEPSYYAPSYYAPSYYAPSYYVRPVPVVYGDSYYSGRPVYRNYRHVQYVNQYRY